jgi:hypothetical protein
MRTGMQKAIWLHILREGGAFTPDEIAQAFNIGRQRANVMLQNMASRSGSLKRYRVDGKAAFGVTGACALPAGVTMDELFGVEPPSPRPVSSVFQLSGAAA